MMYKSLLTLTYGLLVIWTGLWRGIEAQAYKPNALWFCLAMGIVAIVAGFLYRLKRNRAAAITALVAVVVVLGYYFHVFIVQPDKDATYRVGLVILASIAELIVVLFPGSSDSK